MPIAQWHPEEAFFALDKCGVLPLLQSGLAALRIEKARDSRCTGRRCAGL
jgi:hypothetical protein